jgi:hypothetical protein
MTSHYATVACTWHKPTHHRQHYCTQYTHSALAQRRAAVPLQATPADPLRRCMATPPHGSNATRALAMHRAGGAFSPPAPPAFPQPQMLPPNPRDAAAIATNRARAPRRKETSIAARWRCAQHALRCRSSNTSLCACTAARVQAPVCNVAQLPATAAACCDGAASQRALGRPSASAALRPNTNRSRVRIGGP